MASYTELNARPAVDFLHPELFGTDWDNRPEYAEEQYQEGLKTGRESREVFITCGGTWGAHGLSGSQTTSYEGIGYHAHTADLLRGFIASGVKIVIHRYGKSPETIHGPGAQLQFPAVTSV